MRSRAGLSTPPLKSGLPPCTSHPHTIGVALPRFCYPCRSQFPAYHYPPARTLFLANSRPLFSLPPDPSPLSLSPQLRTFPRSPTLLLALFCRFLRASVAHFPQNPFALTDFSPHYPIPAPARYLFFYSALRPSALFACLHLFWPPLATSPRPFPVLLYLPFRFFPTYTITSFPSFSAPCVSLFRLPRSAPSYPQIYKCTSFRQHLRSLQLRSATLHLWSLSTFLPVPF